MKKPAVFLDRDGTINEQMGYINHVSRFVLLKGASEAVRLLNQSGWLAIVVSNQSGVARGYFPIHVVHEVHRHMAGLLKREGAYVDAIYFCPHHPSGKVQEYRRSCRCRKPDTGLIEESIKHFDIDPSGSFFVGDRCSDMELAKRANLRGILVKTGYGLGEIQYVLPRTRLQPIIADDLLSAVRLIVSGKTQLSEI
jgi:D-glycero-D-manno-heptose 1,7-bisphosphate phosphatase